MKQEQRLYKSLNELFDFINTRRNFKKTSDGFMPLHGEILFEKTVSGKRLICVSLAHYFEQNGDLVADPDMEFFLFPELEIAYGASIQHCTGAYTRAMKIENGQIMQNLRAMRDLLSFGCQWMRNLKSQGFFEKQKEAA